MVPPGPDIRNAREAVESILDQLGIRAFVFTVEPKESGWVLSIECATDGGGARGAARAVGAASSRLRARDDAALNALVYEMST